MITVHIAKGTQMSEVTNGRGRQALTPEQKEQQANAKVMYHGTGEHSILCSITVTATERARLRSFCKSLNIPFYGTGELFASIIGKMILGRNTTIPLDEVFDHSEYIRKEALRYDLANETPEVTAAKKEVAKYKAISERYIKDGNKIPASISGILTYWQTELTSLLPDVPEEGEEPVTDAPQTTIAA